MARKKTRVLSLFSGCGGMDLGFTGGFSFRGNKYAKTGFDLVFANDFDSDAARVYRANKKYFDINHFHLGDVKEITAAQIPEFDVMLAGFPCQPFSNAGNRQGINDKNGRGTLFNECERIIKHCLKASGGKLPKAFVFENVKGILSSRMPDGKTVPEEIAHKMSKLGYTCTTKLVKTSDYGVPQNRQRVIIVGVRKDIPPFDFDSMEKVLHSNKIPTNNNNSYELTLGSVLSDIPKDAPQYSDYWKYSPGGQRMVDQIGPCVDGKKSLLKFINKVDLEKISPTIKQGRSWKNIDPKNLTDRFKKIHDNPKKYHAPNFYRRFALGEVAGTITASAQPENCGITHPFENRRFTIREIARIQSFPDDFIFNYSSIAGAYKVIGNAVPPVFAWVLATALNQHLKGH
jgi:DNA (cytosine-5)-methyltransferase 1